MKRLLNTLYVTTDGAYLHKEGESIVVKIESEVRLRVPVHTLGSIVCFGNVLLTPPLMGFCAERGVTISLLSDHDRFLCRVEGPVSGNVLLRREQYRRTDDPEQSAVIARAVIAGKLTNARRVLQRAIRDHGDKLPMPDTKHACVRLGQYVRRLRNPLLLDDLRGLEGEASRQYFGVFDHLITAQKDDFFFHGRTRRPPLDNVNCLLSFVYTILVHDMRSALESVGLDPQVGYLHRERPGRPSLALDLMEEFRHGFADRLVLSLINLKQVHGRGFKQTENGAVMMNDETRKTVLVAYQQRKQEEIEHPFLGESMPLGLVFHIQARLLSRHLRGDLDGYPPFIWK